MSRFRSATTATMMIMTTRTMTTTMTTTTAATGIVRRSSSTLSSPIFSALVRPSSRSRQLHLQPWWKNHTSWQSSLLLILPPRRCSSTADGGSSGDAAAAGRSLWSSSSSWLHSCGRTQHRRQQQHHMPPWMDCRYLSTTRTAGITTTTAATTTTTKTTSTSTSTNTSTSARSSSQLIVSILGPPNAGKSTLFNRLLDKAANRAYKLSSEKGRRRGKTKYSGGRLGSKAPPTQRGGAIVSDIPGTTRDRRECLGRIGDTTFKLIDTAGIDGQRIHNGTKDTVTTQMMNQTWQAAQHADLILLVMDARVGVTTDWIETARWLRKASSANKVLVVANKLEGDSWDYDGSPILENLFEVSRVGFGPAVAVSALHGEGFADLAIKIEELQAAKRRSMGLPERINDTDDDGVLDDDKPLQLAILGRQNVGKSTLVNALLQQDRVICSPTPGLTRDAIAIEWMYEGRPVQLVDTAGIRRIVKRADTIEDLAVQDAMRAMKVADVAVLVLDAQATKLQRQELAIADAVVKEGRALVVVANKQDLLVDADYTADQFAKSVREHIEERLPMLRQTPVVAMSSLYGTHVQALMPVVFRARDRWARVVSTGVLNRWLKEVLHSHPPPMQEGRPTKIKYIIQTKGRPPTFLLFCNHTDLPVSYLRYLIRNFQDTFEYFGMEVRMSIKKSSQENPYSKHARRRSGSGLGGREARTKRNIAALKATGTVQKGRRRRRRSF